MHLWSLCKTDWDNGTGELQPYIPFDAAEDIHKSKARFKVIAAGNRFAKSLIAGMECVAAMTQPGCHIWICGQTLDICDNEWAYIANCLTKTDLWYEYIVPEIMKQLIRRGKPANPDKLGKYIHIRNGKPKSIVIDWPDAPKSIIEQRSYNSPRDYMKLEGVKLTGIVFAEGSKVPSEVWERHLKKRLADKSGWVIYPATPKGKDEVLHPAFLEGQSTELKVSIDYNNKEVSYNYLPKEVSERHITVAKGYMESYETFQHPGFHNPYYNLKSYDSDVNLLFEGKLDESTFKERNFGTFESFAGSFYKGVDWDVCAKDSVELTIPDDANIYVSIDPGRASRASCHWTAICKPDAFGVERWIVFDELYLKGMWTEELVKSIHEKNKELGVVVDGYVADRTITRDTQHRERSVEVVMMDMGIKPLRVPHTMPGHTIDRLNHWKPRLMRGQIVIAKDRCLNLMSELQNLEYERPTYANGKTIQTELLARGDMHAIDDLTYLIYTHPRWTPEPDKPVILRKDRDAQPNSYASHSKSFKRSRTVFAKIGRF